MADKSADSKKTADSKKDQPQNLESVKTDPVQSAREAHLRYVTDESPGITRIKNGKSFSYKDANGKKVTDKETIERIRHLAIPPAYIHVWICPYSNGHLQATGKDSRGRKQYRYHGRWRKIRDETKYDTMIAFGKALPKIRRRVHKDVKLPGLPKEKILATIVELMEKTLIRVGNEEYARENKSYGLTTMQNKHVEIHGSQIHFEFKGKSNVQHDIGLNDTRLARIIKNCQDLPGHELFQYVDENGERHAVHSEDVNTYLKDITGQDFTAKDFRTWYGTVLTARALQAFEAFDSEAEGKKNIIMAVESVAKELGNTKAVCRKCYIHPAIINSYMDKSLAKSLEQKISATLKGSIHNLKPEEVAVMAFLERQLVKG